MRCTERTLSLCRADVNASHARVAAQIFFYANRGVWKKFLCKSARGVGLARINFEEDRTSCFLCRKSEGRCRGTLHVPIRKLLEELAIERQAVIVVGNECEMRFVLCHFARGIGKKRGREVGEVGDHEYG